MKVCDVLCFVCLIAYFVSVIGCSTQIAREAARRGRGQKLLQSKTKTTNICIGVTPQKNYIFTRNIYVKQ